MATRRKPATKPRRPQARSAGRRADILQAALACFTDKGVQATNMEDIRRRSGASTGSIYHHFTSKQDLAAHLYLAGLVDYQDGLLADLGRRRSARAGITGIVRYHLGWVEANPDWARYLHHRRRAAIVQGIEDEIHARNRTFVRALRDWQRARVEAGALADLPIDLFMSLVLGPVMEYTRYHLAGLVKTPLTQAARRLADAVWRSVAPDSD